MMDSEELLGLSVDKLLVRLNTSQSGLTSQEAENRLKICGYNELAKSARSLCHSNHSNVQAASIHCFRGASLASISLRVGA